MSLRSTVRSLTDATKIITPDYRKWLAVHADDPYPDWVVDLLANELKKVQRDRRRSFSGSSAGTCLRAQELTYLGVQPEIDKLPGTDLIGIFDDGRWRHLRWQANLLTAGLLTRIEFPLDWPNKRMKGSMDGVGIVRTDHPNASWRGLEYGFELKGVNPFQYSRLVAKKYPKADHMAQIMRYFLTSGVDLFVCVYENKATQQFHEWVIRPDEELMLESQWELDELNKDADAERLRPQLKTCAARMGPYWEGCAFAGVGGPCERTKEWAYAS